MSPRVSSRLVRLLNLVPYFLANPGISADDAAEELGISVKELMKDLHLLWICGLPGYGPGDLIDLAFGEDSIEVTFSAGIDRPLRLTATEATAMLMALRALAEQPSTVDPTAVRSAIAKIEAAAGRANERAEVATAEPAAQAPVAERVREATVSGQALRLHYFSATRDALTDRVVDPMQIMLVEEHSYLQAWCRLAEGVRLFRFDRIESAQILDEPARPPQARDVETRQDGIFADDEDLPRARLRIAPEALWVLDYYPLDDIVDLPDGGAEARMRYASTDWMSRLVVGFGGDIAVLDPADLRTAVTAHAAHALAAYRRTGP